MKTHLIENALFDTILETIAALVIIMDQEGRVVLFNEACEKLTGYSSAEVEGTVIWELLIPEAVRDEVIAVFDDLRAGHFPNRHENQWILQNGTLRTIDWSNSAWTDEDGEVKYIIATGVDITKRRATEIREREQAFAGIIDLCADAIISVGADGQITLFNQGAEEIFGYSSQEAIGEPLSLLMPDHIKDIHHHHLTRFAGATKPAQRMGERAEVYGMRKNGELFPAEASISKQRVNGNWLFTAVLRDITEQHRAKKNLEQINAEMQRSNSDLEYFATVASHDLQEPLRKIQAFGERLQSKYGDLLPERGADYLTRMQGAAARMSILIRDLLAFSRVTSQGKPFESIDLNKLVEGVVSDLQIRIESTGGEVDIGDLPELDADPLQMQQLFQNLISNALKFHRDDVPPLVSLRAEMMNDQQSCQVVVEDNGIGFEEIYLDRIFEVFQRLHGRGVFEGTGMGLAIARKIIERHHGTITAQSRPGEGSRFIVILPLHQPDPAK